MSDIRSKTKKRWLGTLVECQSSCMPKCRLGMYDKIKGWRITLDRIPVVWQIDKSGLSVCYADKWHADMVHLVECKVSDMPSNKYFSASHPYVLTYCHADMTLLVVRRSSDLLQNWVCYHAILAKIPRWYDTPGLASVVLHTDKSSVSSWKNDIMKRWYICRSWVRFSRQACRQIRFVNMWDLQSDTLTILV